MRKYFAAVCVCLALAACSSIPTSGPVEKGDSDVAVPKALSPILEGPSEGATPRAIVQGFLTAAAGGAVNGFDTARQFLSPSASSLWDPLAKVTVFDSRQVVPSFDDVTGTFTYSVPVAATLDADGVLVEASPDQQTTLEFRVSTDASGNSRIKALDDGIVMNAADFGRYYRPIKLFFLSKDNSTLVPELRWFPGNEQVATATARELVKGPSPWLADAVNTGFPAGSALNVDAVVVESGVATVALAPGSAGDAAQRSLAAEQLRLTLTQLPTVHEVVATVGMLPLAGDGSAAPVPAPLPGEQAAVIVGRRLGMLEGNDVKITPAEVGLVPEGATGLALSYDAQTVAMVVDGSIVTSNALSRATLEPLADSPDSPVIPASPDAPEVPILPTVRLVEGRSLIPPSYDPYGWLWTSESLSAGVIAIASPDGVVSEIPAAQLDGRAIQALAVSGDGARVAVLSRASGVQVLEIMAVVRGEQGEPLALGSPLAMGPAVGASIDVVWLDDITVATLSNDSGGISMSTVGGWTTDIAIGTGATSIAARNGVRTLLAVEDDGVLVARSGNSWARKATGVSDVTFAG